MEINLQALIKSVQHFVGKRQRENISMDLGGEMRLACVDRGRKGTYL